MRERLFRFKQFSVSHEAAAMKVGTDGVTLGAWATVDPGNKVLDAGAGCGLIGLMAAQRGAGQVLLLEIDGPAAEEAAANALASPWAARIKTVNGDFLSFRDGTFDRIVCNPPFFTTGESAPDPARATARHEGTLTLEALMDHSHRLLAPHGSLSIIIPAGSEQRARFAARIARLHCRRSTQLLTKAGAPPRRVLMEFSMDECHEESSVIAIDSPEYKSLTSPFYL